MQIIQKSKQRAGSVQDAELNEGQGADEAGSENEQDSVEHDAMIKVKLSAEASNKIPESIVIIDSQIALQGLLKPRG